LRLELELFEEYSSKLIDKRIGPLKSAVIETVREQDYSLFTNLPGKLYFKELLVNRLNERLGRAAIRDVHFSSFYLQ
jgi:flagellar basal body-associated protein FliL